MNDYLELITKKLAGEISQEEDLRLSEWISASSENELQFRRLEEVWLKGQYVPSIQGQEETFQKITEQLGIADEKVISKPESPIPSLGKYWMRAAAVFVFLTASITLIWFYQHQNSNEEVAIENQPLQVVSKSNPRGQKSVIRLPDGSEVRLNAESYLEYPQDFKSNRNIKLIGEAFFDVQRDPDHPFTVTSGDITVTVLGTTFNVQAFPFEENMSVAVASGFVEVEKRVNGEARKMSQLHRRQMVKINHKRGDFEVSQFDPAEVLAWKDGVLVFNKASFESIVHQLERWYGVDFIIRRNKPVIDGFTGRYNNPSLKVILEGMSYASDFTYRIEGDSVIIQ